MTSTNPTTAPATHKAAPRWIWIILILALAAGGGRQLFKKTEPFAVACAEFGRLPALTNGRFQPLDSVARNALLQLRGKQSLNCEPWKSWYQSPKILSASQWLAEVAFAPDVADTRPVFRIDHPDLKGLLALPLEADAEKQNDGKHFAWQQIAPRLPQLQDAVRQASAIKNEQRDVFQKATVRLWSTINLYVRLQNMAQPRLGPTIAMLKGSAATPDAKNFLELFNETQPQDPKDWPSEVEAYFNSIAPGVAALRAKQTNQPHDEAALAAFKRDMVRWEGMGMEDQPMLVPPHHPEKANDNWMRMGGALMETAGGTTPHFSIAAWAKIADAAKKSDTAAFTAAVKDYRLALAANGLTGQLKKAGSEHLFNKIEPFYKSMTPYVLAFLCVIFFWIHPTRWAGLRKVGVWLLFAGFVIHTGGIIARMVLEGRPPVTNLYSSAVFIGWGAVVLGMALERPWRNGLGIAIGSTIGFSTLIIAHHLSLSGDTMEMMRAVLDTNFWLATHVVIVTLGYSATYVAGVLGIMFIILGLFTPMLSQTFNPEDNTTMSKALAKMIYGILCFATLFSFVGTVLGGIWADQSWGRFWGWDPKENGALIIVLWNALILHARWGGLAKERGMAALAVAGNIVTSWSWFGTNLLGIGLHSYGFTDSGFWWLIGFVATQLIIIAMAQTPLTAWRSFSQLKAATPATQQRN